MVIMVKCARWDDRRRSPVGHGASARGPRFRHVILSGGGQGYFENRTSDLLAFLHEPDGGVQRLGGSHRFSAHAIVGAAWTSRRIRAPSPERTRSVESLGLRLSEWGDPACTPLVLCHGMFDHGRAFDLLAPLLAARFRVIAVWRESAVVKAAWHSWR
jgi:hypothetical protein